MTPFGKRLRELREERGVTQKEMAQALRVSPAYLSALEHGRRGQPHGISSSVSSPISTSSGTRRRNYKTLPLFRIRVW